MVVISFELLIMAHLAKHACPPPSPRQQNFDEGIDRYIKAKERLKFKQVEMFGLVNRLKDLCFNGHETFRTLLPFINSGWNSWVTGRSDPT